MRNGFSVHFTSYESLMAKRPPISSLAQLCAMAGRLCRAANCHVYPSAPEWSVVLGVVPRE